MDHQQRVLLAFLLSFAALMLWRAWVVKELPPPPQRALPAQPPPASARATAAAKPAVPVALPIQHGKKAEDIVVEAPLYRVTFSTEGAVVKSWVLKNYRDEQKKPLDVVNRTACEQLGFPMSLISADQETMRRLNTGVYVAKPSSTSLTAPADVTFTYSDGKVQASKRFSFGRTYPVRVEVSVSDGQHYLPLEVAWPGGFGDHSLPSSADDSIRQVVYELPEGKPEVLFQKKVNEDRLIPGPLEFAGLEDFYFLGLFLPGSPDEAFRFGRSAGNLPGGQKGNSKEPSGPLEAMLGSAAQKPLAFRLFVAPKDLDVLRAEQPRLDGLVDFGWFSIIAEPLFLALRYIYDHVAHNYGWAIVLLTVFINMAMFPLKLKSLRSAQEMQRIAPLVKSIQEKYKNYKFNDPRKQRMNQEIMKLYQEHNVNPLGSCLPMVLQLPFLYGFYNVLKVSIELRHAPWILWIQDLSAPDGFHLLGFPLPILPTVMIVSMYILQQMTPMTTADPAQQRMMKVMPLLFGVTFYRFASGLVLYWLTGSLVGIAQQAFINRVTPLPQQLATPRKAVVGKEKA